MNKKLSAVLLTVLALCGLSLRLQAQNNPYVMTWDIGAGEGFNLVVTGGTPYTGQALSPAVGTTINAGYPYGYVLFNTLNVDVQDLSGNSLGTTTIKLVTNAGSTYPLDTNNLITFNYNAAASSYSDTNKFNQRNYFNLTKNTFPAPAVVSNEGWSNGLGNQSPVGVNGENFWAIDYGSETGRWTITNGAAYQAVTLISGNSGSRAYAVGLAQATNNYWFGQQGTGVAMDGLWQIEIKIGSSGTGNFCETFYLSERSNLNPGSANYADGSAAGGPAGFSREIDIMETHWHPDGPQFNLPTGGGTGWVKSLSSGQPGYNQQIVSWSDIGGAPTSDFVTFGCLIRDGNIWFFAYKSDGSQWYSTDPIAKNNPTYVQKGNFVPYIGTWCVTSGSSANWKTGYRNFVYLGAADPLIAGLDPKANPEGFGPALFAKIAANNAQKPAAKKR